MAKNSVERAAATIECLECEHVEQFVVPTDAREANKRRGVLNYLEDVRRAQARRHRKVTTCQSSRFLVSFVLYPPKLVASRR